MSKNVRTQIGKVVGKSLDAYHKRMKPTVDELKFKEQYQGRIIDCMVGEVDDNYIETPETDAPIVKLEHSKEGVVKIPSIKGKTILVDADGNETDTPAEGCRLVSVGESEDNKLIILSKNKNLINVEDFTFGSKCKLINRNKDNGEVSITYNGAYAGFSIPLTDKISEMVGKSYKASYSEVVNSNSNAKLSIQLSGTYKDGNNFYLYPSTNVVTITDEMKTLNFTVFPNNTATSLEGSFTIKKLQLEQGTVATTFEKPKYHKTEILLDEPLFEGN